MFIEIGYLLLYTSDNCPMKHRNTPLIVGHRGARGNVVDNSRESFTWAIKHGVDEIETDSHLTSDGVIVQLHNRDYTDKNGATHLIAETTYAQILHDLPETMTLPELIEFVNKRSRLMLEIKPNVPAAPIIATVRHYLKNGWQPADFSFASFDFQILKEVHQALPDIERIVLEEWSALRALRRARKVDTTYLSMNQQYLWWGFIRWATLHNHKIYTYPFPRTKLPFNHKKPAKWAKHGLHGIITDQPENFK
jgi:glycerophosphoryl diester phosphodiesterase